MKRGKFSLSHYKLLTCKMGQLIPVAWFEALPGDTIQQATSALIRCAPLVTPVMHPVSVRFHHFFVPNRIIWANWENFITGGPTGLDATVHPSLTVSANVAVSSLGDHLGLPTSGLSGAISVNVLPFRAYALIWNEFYRDQDLQSALTVSTGDGADSTTSTALQNVCWEKDYLTSSRPWEQKGPAVTVPVGGSATVKPSNSTLLSGVQPQPAVTYVSGGVPSGSALLGRLATSFADVSSPALTAGGTGVYFNNLYADLSTATGVDINVVRHAFAMQRFQEARARYGSRYVEYLRYLGVRSSDARLQRPEYLGGGKQTIQFSEVLQTAPTTAGTGGGTGGVGQFGGHGITALRSNRYRRFFEEHGIVMSLMSVRPRTMYSQRVKRGWMRGLGFAGLVATKEDYWQRELQHIGQQQVNGMEADASVASSTTLGFQDRYDEYRREESSVAGAFRSTLDVWHLSREFGSAPSLNSTFVSCVPSTRVFADTTNDNLYCMVNHSIQARRLLTQVGTSMTF